LRLEPIELEHVLFWNMLSSQIAFDEIAWRSNQKWSSQTTINPLQTADRPIVELI
jgi:hypothetical protein